MNLVQKVKTYVNAITTCKNAIEKFGQQINTFTNNIKNCKG
jgi:hypothetical protein